MSRRGGRHDFAPFVFLAIRTSIAPHCCALNAQDDGWHTIEFETTQVTAPDITISPDGSRVVFGSNRGGSDGTIYVLNLADGEIS